MSPTPRKHSNNTHSPPSPNTRTAAAAAAAATPPPSMILKQGALRKLRGGMTGRFVTSSKIQHARNSNKKFSSKWVTRQLVLHSPNVLSYYKIDHHEDDDTPRGTLTLSSRIYLEMRMNVARNHYFLYVCMKHHERWIFSCKDLTELEMWYNALLPLCCGGGSRIKEGVAVMDEEEEEVVVEEEEEEEMGAQQAVPGRIRMYLSNVGNVDGNVNDTRARALNRTPSMQAKDAEEQCKKLRRQVLSLQSQIQSTVHYDAISPNVSLLYCILWNVLFCMIIGKDRLNALLQSQSIHDLYDFAENDCIYSIALLFTMNLLGGMMMRDRGTLRRRKRFLRKKKKSIFLHSSSNSDDHTRATSMTMRRMRDERIPAGTETIQRAPVDKMLYPEIQALKDQYGEQSLEFIRAVANQCNRGVVGYPNSIGTQEEEEKIMQTYWNVDPSKFKLRIGPNYKKYKKKNISGPALYDLIALDIVNTDGAIMNVDETFSVPHVKGMTDVNTGNEFVPPLLVVNIMIPRDPPAFRVDKENSTKGDFCMAILYLGITEQTLNDLRSNSQNASPAVRLFSEWCKRGDNDPDFRTRLKMIVNIDGIEDLGIPSFLKKYNGKPSLVKKHIGSLTHRTTRDGLRYSEININLRNWRYVSRKGVYSAIPFIARSKFSLGLTIEGRDDDELPEVLLGGCHIMNFDFVEAPLKEVAKS